MRPHWIRAVSAIFLLTSAQGLAAGEGKRDAPPKEMKRLIEAGHEEYTVDVGGTLDGFNTRRYVNLDGHHMMEVAGFQPNVELTIENVGETDVVNPRLVINDRRDWFSIDTLIEEIIEPGMSDREKAFAVFQVFRDNFYHHNAPELYYENGVKKGDVYDPIKHLNCYENTGCGPMAIGMATVWSRLGLKSRVLNFRSAHWISEVFFDGAWHVLDADRKAFYRSRDNRRIVSAAEAAADKWLVTRTHHQGFAAPDHPKYDASRARSYGRNTGTPYEAAMGHTMALTLRPGESLVRRWDNVGKYHDNWRQKEQPPPKFANGKIVYEPDLTKSHILDAAERHYNIVLWATDNKRPYMHAAEGHRGSGLVFRVCSPYCIVGGRIQVRFPCKRNGGRLPKVHLSYDGDHWRNVWHGRRGEMRECDVSIDEFIGTRRMNALYEYYVKIDWLAFSNPCGIGIDFLRFETDVEMAIPSLPTLRVGANEVVYRDETKGPRRIKVTHRWRESSANRPPKAPSNPTSPKNGSIVDSRAPRLTWTRAIDPDGDSMADYHVVVRDRPDMRLPVSPNLERLTSSGKPEWRVPAGWLIPSKRYFWRVRAKDDRGAWSPWSETWSFVAGRTTSKPKGGPR